MPSETQFIESLRFLHKKANLLFGSQIVLSLLVSLSAVFSILTNDNITLYWLATTSFILLIVRWWINTAYMKVRNHSLSARRAAILFSGLGEKIDDSTRKSLIAINCKISKENINEQNCYTTNSPLGFLRLIEIVEECAFCSQKTHASSSKFIFRIFFMFFTLVSIILLFQIPTATNDMLVAFIRVFFAATVFFLSSDVYGKATLHKLASKKLAKILQRAESLLTNINKFTTTDAVMSG